MTRGGLVARFTILAILLLAFSSFAFAQDAVSVGDTIEASTEEANVEYTISLEAEETVVISLSVEDPLTEFDPYLELLDSSSTVIAFDDDSGEDRNSLLEFTAPETGTYTIVVRAFAGLPTGDYTLSVSAAGESESGSGLGGLLGGSSSSSAAQGEGDLVIGDTIEGTASNDQPEYTIALAEGQSVQIDLQADWDTYLELLNSDGEIIAEDDDGGDGFNSRLFFTALATETYTIRVRAFGGDATGDFTLTVVESNVVSQVSGGELSFNEPISVAPDGALSLVFNFEGTQGDVVNISALSEGDSDLEATLLLTGPTGAEVVDSSDIGSYYNPQLRRVELPSTGTYALTVQGSSDTPLVDSFVLTLESTELLLATDGPVTVVLNEDLDFDVVSLNVDSGVSYVVTITSNVELDSTLYGNMREPGESFADTRMSLSGSSQMAFVYEAGVSGRTSFELEYFAFSGDEVEITVEANPLN